MSERATAIQDWRGQRLGLPKDGPGAVAGFGRRIVALFIDWVPCAVLAQLLTENPAWSALVFFALLTTLSVTLFGRTPGHAAVGARVAMLDGGRPPFGAAVVRTLLICLALIPPAIYNADGRGLHDRAAGTIVLRTR
ncbi:MAG TPA: RDD family protein [Pseudonocardiaceae bacterium]